MAIKQLKSNLFSIGVISAISAASLLFGGLEAKAQTTDSNQMNQMDQNQQNQSPTQPSQNNSTPASPVSPATVQPSDNISPSTNSVPSTPSTPSTTTSPITQYSPNQAPLLTVGSQGQAVKDVQAFLSQQGLYNYQPDGIYGTQTRAAVRQFQQSQNLLVDGIIGPQTWGAMLNSGNVSNSGQAQ